MSTNGNLTTLVSFDFDYGFYPYKGLIVGQDGYLYGTTFSHSGTIFRMSTEGVLTTLAGDFAASPQGRLTLAGDGYFYGTTYFGQDEGTVFRWNTNGAFATVIGFNGTNGDGNPSSSLTLGADGSLYGTTPGGGNGYLGGTIFQVSTGGLFTTLYVLGGGTNGFHPGPGLTLGNDGNLYGTARGGSTGNGTVFQVTTNGLWKILASFNGANGADPFWASLALGVDGNFYGTTYDGGSSDQGTVFRVTTNGVLTSLVAFAGTNGANPLAGLTLANDGSFYGTASQGGAYTNFGTVFRVTTNGLLTTLASFAGANGARPSADLIFGGDGNLYGTTYSGGTSNWGTVFQMATNGTLTTLFSFFGTNGANPSAGLTLGSDGNFYGTTSSGGNAPGFIYRLRRGAYIQSFGMESDGFRITVINVGGSGWTVMESSTNLANWTPIQTNGTAAQQQFIDPIALTQPRQFYRVRQL